MVKKDLELFLEKVERKALESVNKKWDLLIKEEKIKSLLPFADKLEKIQDKINKLFMEYQDTVLDMKEDKKVNYNTSNYTISDFRQLTGEQLEIKTFSNCGFKGEVEILNNKKKKEIGEVKNEYYKIKMNIKSLSTAKKGKQYLEELGFDLTELDKKLCTSLVCKVDKSKIFVCGENK